MQIRSIDLAKAFLALVFCNFIWSANPMMNKMIMEGFSPLQAAWLRYFSAFASYVIITWVLKFYLQSKKSFFCFPNKEQGLFFLIIVALMTFIQSPITQMLGLYYSRATDNAIIVAMEPLITVLLAWIFLREKAPFQYFIVFGISIVGFLFLSDFSLSRPNVGNLLLLVSQTGEASYSVFSRRLLKKFEPQEVFGSALGLGAVVLTILGWIYGAIPSIDSFLHMSSRNWLGLLWVGPIGTTLTYLFWMIVLVRAPVMWMVLTLLIQPVLGSILGAIFLSEHLSWTQMMGGAMILISVMGYMVFSSPAAISHENIEN